MPSNDVAVLMHLAGFLIGVALYAILFALVVRRLRESDRLPLLTAILGLIWNLTGLAAYGIRDLLGRDPHPYLIASAYSALGVLPAVVVHSVLRSDTCEMGKTILGAHRRIDSSLGKRGRRVTPLGAHCCRPSGCALIHSRERACR